MSEQTPSPADPNKPSQASIPPVDKTAAAPRKRRRRWPYITAGVVVLLLLAILVIFAPAIASTGVVRSYIVSKINRDYLNGRLVVQNWSIGWTSGIKVTGVQVFDVRDSQVAELDEFTTQLSLLNAIRGKLAMGDTVVRGLNANIDRNEDGTNKISDLFKHSKEQSSSSSKLPDLSGNFDFSKCTIQYTDHESKRSEVSSLDGTIKIPDINQPIEQHLTVVTKVGNGDPGTLKLDGTVAAISDNEVNLNALSGNETIVFDHWNLGVLSAFFMASHTDLSLAGMANGKFALSSTSKNDVSSTSTITIDGFRAGGAGLGAVAGANGQPEHLVVNVNQIQIALAFAFDGKKLHLDNAHGFELSMGKLDIKRRNATTITPLWAEDWLKMHVGADVLASGEDRSINLSDMGLTTADGIVTVQASGEIDDPAVKRQIKNLKITLGYDLQKMFSVVHPLMGKDADGKPAMDGMKLTGKVDNQVFNLNGSLAANKPFKDAIADLDADGQLTIPSLDYDGMSIQKFILGTHLHGGILTDLLAGQTAPGAAIFNGGALDIGGFSVDLRTDHLLVSGPAGKLILQAIQLNPILAAKFGAKLSPIFADPSQATGSVNLLANTVQSVPLDKLMMANDPLNQGVADLTLNVQDLTLVGGQIGKALQAIGQNAINGNIKDGKIHIEHGIVNSNIAVTIGSEGQSLGFNGGIGMSDLRLIDFKMIIGPRFLGNLGKTMPQGLSVAMTGTADKPQVDLAGALKSNVGNLLPGQLQNLISPRSEVATTQPGGENPLGNLLDQTGKVLGQGKQDKHHH